MATKTVYQSPTEQELAQLDAQTAAANAGGVTINRGDTLSAIAKKYGVSVNDLLAANPNIKDPNKISAGMNLNLPANIATPVKSPTAGKSAAQAAADAANRQQPSQPMQEQPGVLDRISGALSNPNVGSAALQAGGAAAGYMLTEAERKKQEQLFQDQMKKIGGINQLQTLKFDPERDAAYKQQRQFQQDIIAGKGYTAEERQMQAQDDLRAAEAGRSARAAALEQMARTGMGATGSGASLASALMGSQSQANIQSQAGMAREASAQNRMQQAIAAVPQSFEAQFANQLELARQQSAADIEKAKLSSTQADKLAQMSAAKGQALAGLAGTAADLGTSLIQDRTILPSNATAEQQRIQAQADADRRALQAKAGAASNVGSTPQRKVTAQPAQQKPATTPPQSFNTTNLKNTAYNAAADAATKKAEEAKAKLASSSAGKAVSTVSNLLGIK